MYPSMRYVQEGLLAHWDGIENVGRGKHDSNATVWKDLVGNCDAVLQDATFSDDALIMSTATDVDKIGAIIQNLDTAPFEIDEDAFYIEVTMKARKSANIWIVENIVSLKRVAFGLRHNFSIDARAKVLTFNTDDGIVPASTSTNAPAISTHFSVGFPFCYTTIWDNQLLFDDYALINGDVYTPWAHSSTGTKANLGQFLNCPKNTANWAFEIQRISMYRGINLERTRHNLAIDRERFGLV